jgi:hypothetical protein
VFLYEGVYARNRRFPVNFENGIVLKTGVCARVLLAAGAPLKAITAAAPF